MPSVLDMGTLKVSGVFENCQFVVDFAASLSLTYKGKEEIRRKIVENGGTLSYVLTKQTNFLVTGDSEQALSSYKGRTAVKLGIPVVPFDFITDCIKSGKLVDPQPFPLSETLESQNFSSGKIVAKNQREDNVTKPTKKQKLPDLNRIKVWPYKAVDGPEFDEPNCEIVKDALLAKTNPGEGPLLLYSLELHFIPSHVPCTSSRYRLFTHQGTLMAFIMGYNEGTKECRYFSSSEEAFGAFIAIIDQQFADGYKKLSKYPSPNIGSDRLKQLVNEESSSQEDSSISPEVANLINYIWNEAVGSLADILATPLSSIKLEDVEKAEAILLLLRKSIDDSEGVSTIHQLSDEFFSAIPHKNRGENISSKHLIAQKQDLCQLIKDMVSIGESTNWKTRQDVHSKYRALKSYIECLNHESDGFKKIQKLVKSSETSPPEIDVLNVYSIHRPVEETAFSPHIGNNALLFHASKVANFVGILSRGLLMPKIVVDDFGGQRSDPGMLGSGIYFSNSASTSAKYSAPGSKGSRLMLVNEVALGKVKEFKTFAMDLTSPPSGYSSCHGVRNTDNEPSDFKDDEFAIYNGNQQKIRYLVEFVLRGDVVVADRDDASIDSGFFDDSSEAAPEDHRGSVVLTDVMSIVDPLTKVEAGLKGTGDKSIPLQSVHIRARLLDLAAQVIVFQEYSNNSSTPIEAKYVFPLDDMAAVCGFEAFINGKHIVGEVKEKEQAHKEYREAISQGHGAYLMDEETPDVFTVSVGNLPPGAQVLIKITYVTELTVDGEHICFSLPGSVAPWTRDKALEEVTQTYVDTVRIREVGPCDPAFDVSMKVSVEMPFEIRSLDSPTHAMKVKRTATKAVIELEPGQSLGDGFQLLIGLAEIHVPRMWVERHTNNSDRQACMLTFYPEFEAESPSEVEVIFLLDLSCSMKGSNLNDAKKILLMCLSLVKEGWIFNVLVFGSKHSELFLYSVRKDKDSFEEAKKFVESLTADKGSTELWRVLRKLYMLPTLSTADHPRNLFLISDGHVTEEETTLGLIRNHCQSDRLFSLGVGSTANRYLLRAMSRVGAGASEFFDGSAKSKWERKVRSQLSKAEQPGLTSVGVTWQQHDSGSSPPVQAPHQLLSLFNGSRQVVYGFVDNCTQATLSAEVNGTTVSTMVSTADLNITKGKILHQLTARAIIRDWDEGSLHEQRTGHEIVKRDRKDFIVSLSKTFSVVSKFTSFVAVEHREKDEKFKEGQGPSILELVSTEDVDILEYIAWESRPVMEKNQELNIEEKLEKKLQEAKVLETSSVLQCERLYKEIIEEAKENLGADQPVTVKAIKALSNLYTLMGEEEKACRIFEENESAVSDFSLDVEVPRNSTSKDSDWSDPTEGSAFSSGDSSDNTVSVAEAELLDEEELEFCEMDQQGMDEDEEASEAPSPRVITKDMNSASKTRTQDMDTESESKPESVKSIGTRDAERKPEALWRARAKPRMAAFFRGMDEDEEASEAPSPRVITRDMNSASKTRTQDMYTESESKPEPVKSIGTRDAERKPKALRRAMAMSPMAMSLRGMDEDEEASEAPSPRVITRDMNSATKPRTEDESKKAEKKESYKPQMERGDDASLVTQRAASSSSSAFLLPRQGYPSNVITRDGVSAFEAPGFAFTSKLAALPTTEASSCQAGSGLSDKLQQPQKPLLKKAAPVTFGGRIVQREGIPFGRSCRFGGQNMKISQQSQRNQLFGKSGEDDGLFDSSKKKAIQEIPTFMEKEAVPPVVGRRSGSSLQNMEMSNSAQSSGSSTFARFQTLQRNPLNFPQTGGLFGNSQQIKMFSQPLKAATDPCSSRSTLNRADRQMEEEVRQEIPATIKGDGAVPMNAEPMLKQETCPVPGNLQQPLPPPPAPPPPPPASLAPLHRPTLLPGGSRPPTIVPARASLMKDFPGVSKTLKGVTVASKQSASATTTAVTGFGAPPPPPPPACSAAGSSKLLSVGSKPPPSIGSTYEGKVCVRSVEMECPGLREAVFPDKREKLERIFTAQNSEGFWNVDDLPIIGIDTQGFTDLLAGAGARSLGLKVFESVKRLLATFMMLAFMKLRLHVVFPLTLPFGQPESEVTVGGLGVKYSKDITKALKWVKIQERKIPLLYSRLEFGANWEAATRTMAWKMKI